MSTSDKRAARCLRGWIHCVRRVRQSGLQELLYHQRYCDVLDAAANASPSAGDRVLALVKPWATLQALRNASDPLLVDLITQAQDCESELNPRSVTRRLVDNFKPVFLLVCLSVGAAYVSLAARAHMENGMRWSRISFYNLQGKLLNLSTLEQSAALALLLVVFGTILLKNTRKS